MHTPWGQSDHVEQIAPGILRVSTPSHGGYRVYKSRVEEMPAPLRDFEPFAGAGWYEEDCDWCVVVLAYPDLFDAWELRGALRMLTSMVRWETKWSTLYTRLGLEAALHLDAIRAKIEAWEREHSGWYEAGCSSFEPGKGWFVRFEPVVLSSQCLPSLRQLTSDQYRNLPFPPIVATLPGFPAPREAVS